MRDTRIKICGITSPEDAKLSWSLGADYLGMIFADSKRRVDVDTARLIRRAVPKAMLIGVFVDAPLADVVELSCASRVNLVQLHGHESPAYCDTLLSRLSLPIIKALGSRQLDDPTRLKEYTRISYFLLDLDKNRGVRSDISSPINGQQQRLWSTAAGLRRTGYRIFLAGALTAANVREAVHHVGPYCIDVARGVEKAPGVKDAKTLNRFIQEARR
ncbi:MAG: hypothetical protein OEN01_00245 [Candidatus Krumholzibacteria bacterium]|nr:hypothetical protein [Candidatus Krumholzibacteria bacterium]